MTQKQKPAGSEKEVVISTKTQKRVKIKEQ